MSQASQNLPNPPSVPAATSGGNGGFLRWPSIFPAIFFIIVESVLEIPRIKAYAAHPDDGGGYLLGEIGGGLILSLLVAWVAYRIMRRSRAAGTFAFSAVLVVLAIGTFKSPWPGTEQVIEKGILDPFESKRQAAESDFDQLKMSGALHFAGINAPEEVERRLDLIRRALNSDNALLNAGDHARVALIDNLSAAGVTDSRRDQILDDFDAKIHWGERRNVFSADANVLVAAQSIYGFLHDHQGQWTCSRLDGHVSFENQALQAKFDDLLAAVRSAGAGAIE